MITLIYIDYIDYIPPCWDSPQCLHLEEKHRICHAHNVGANLTKLHKLSPNSHLRSRSRRCKRRHNLLPASRCPWNRKPSGKWAQSMKRFEKVCKGQSMKSTVLESFNIFYFFFSVSTFVYRFANQSHYRNSFVAKAPCSTARSCR